MDTEVHQYSSFGEHMHCCYAIIEKTKSSIAVWVHCGFELLKRSSPLCLSKIPCPQYVCSYTLTAHSLQMYKRTQSAVFLSEWKLIHVCAEPVTPHSEGTTYYELHVRQFRKLDQSVARGFPEMFLIWCKGWTCKDTVGLKTGHELSTYSSHVLCTFQALITSLRGFEDFCFKVIHSTDLFQFYHWLWTKFHSTHGHTSLFISYLEIFTSCYFLKTSYNWHAIQPAIKIRLKSGFRQG